MWKKKVYISDSAQPFRLNRTKIDLFFDCERCFVLDQKFGIKRPFGTPLVMNNKIVNTLKDELEICREKKQIHPQVLENNLNYIPNNFELLNDWKNPFKGVKYTHKKTNFLLNGTIDDVWINKTTKKNYCLIIKSTSKKEQLSYEQIWSGYWRQLSFYTYLLEKNSIEMSKTGRMGVDSIVVKLNSIGINLICILSNFIERSGFFCSKFFTIHAFYG